MSDFGGAGVTGTVLNNSGAFDSIGITGAGGATKAVSVPFTLSGTLGALSDLTSAFGSLAGFYVQLQPASWRGIQFFVRGSSVRAGRRKAIHEYPFRDEPWIEDLGKRGRAYGFEGFLVGDDVAQQMSRMLDAIDGQPGPGELVHPGFGSLQVESVEFEALEQWDQGRVWRFRAEWVQPRARSLQLLPTGQADTQANVFSGAGVADGEVAGSWMDTLANTGSQVLAFGKQAVAAVQPFVQTGLQLAGDASRIAGVVSSISGSFGRYTGGKGLSSIGSALQSAQQVRGAVQTALTAASSARALVSKTGSVLSGLVDL